MGSSEHNRHTPFPHVLSARAGSGSKGTAIETTHAPTEKSARRSVPELQMVRVRAKCEHHSSLELAAAIASARVNPFATRIRCTAGICFVIRSHQPQEAASPAGRNRIRGGRHHLAIGAAYCSWMLRN